MKEAEKREIFDRYREHARRFDSASTRSSDREQSVAQLRFPRPVEDRLTPRELDVLRLMAEGLANKEIATRLYISQETVKSHVRHLLVKLPARSRAQAVAVGFRRGVIR